MKRSITITIDAESAAEMREAAAADANAFQAVLKRLEAERDEYAKAWEDKQKAVDRIARKLATAEAILQAIDAEAGVVDLA